MGVSRRRFLKFCGVATGAGLLGAQPLPRARAAGFTSVPLIERVSGPTATVAVVGNGTLTSGISRHGELVMMKWPSLSFNDHLLHRTKHKIPLLWSLESYDRFLGARQEHGHFAGVVLDITNGNDTSWFRDSSWRTEQAWVDDAVPWLRTVHQNGLLGLTVEVDDIVAYRRDVHIRTYRLRSSGSTATYPRRLRTVTGMAPCLLRDLRQPNVDWIRDEHNGWITTELSGDVLACNRLSPPNLPNVVESLSELDRLMQLNLTSGEGLSAVTLALGFSRQPIRSRLFEATGKSFDLNNLPETGAALIRQRAAVVVQDHQLDWNERGEASLSIAIAVGPTPVETVGIMRKTLEEHKVVANATVVYWRQRMSAAQLPSVEKRFRPVLMRTLVNLLLAQDPVSGAIAGGFSHQPAYGFVWPRENGFINYCLASAGFVQEAMRNAQFLASVQRSREGQDATNKKDGPIGSWAQCYSTDKRPAWVYDLEIDELGLGCWALMVPALFINSEARKDYLRKVYPAIGRSADLMTRWKAPNGLQPKAREDDLPWLSQTIYGGSSVLTGLDAAILAASMLGGNDPRAATWKKRRDELEQAIWKHYWSNREGFGTGLGASPFSTSIWPAELLDPTKERAQKYGSDLFRWLQPFLRRQQQAINPLHEWWYVPRVTCSLAYLWRDRPERANDLNQLLQLVLAELPISGIHAYGESCALMYDPKRKSLWYSPRVSTPHNFTATFAYLTAVNASTKNKTSRPKD